MISLVSRHYLGKRLLDCFHIAHTHRLGRCRCVFLGAMTSDLIFNLFSLRPLLCLPLCRQSGGTYWFASVRPVQSIVLVCYASPPLTRQCVGVTFIYPMLGHCVRHWPTFKRHWGGVYYVHALPPA